MVASNRNQVVILFLLVLGMVATRLYHFGVVPDASWALFYLGGFYLRGVRSFAVLLAGAVVMDYISTQHMGVSSYCLSPAYGFVLPAYGLLWFGGAWFRTHWRGVHFASVAPLIASVLVAVSGCFLLTNGSFYWLSGRVATPTLAGWATNAGHWYAYFLRVPCMYIAIAALVHVAVTRLMQSTLHTALGDERH